MSAVEASIKLPDGWRFATALEPASTKGATTVFKTAPLETVVDSPVRAGRFYQRYDLAPGDKTPVYLGQPGMEGRDRFRIEAPRRRRGGVRPESIGEGHSAGQKHLGSDRAHPSARRPLPHRARRLPRWSPLSALERDPSRPALLDEILAPRKD